MRFLFLLFALPLSALACTDRPAAAPAPPSPSLAPAPSLVQRAAPEAPPSPPSVAAGPVERTVVDGDDFAIQLPGRWDQSRTPDGGYDFRRGNDEIVVLAMPLKDGVNAAKSAETLSSAQRITALDRFHCTALGDARHVASAHVGALLSAFTCPTPPLVMSFAAVSGVGDRVISYEAFTASATT